MILSQVVELHICQAFFSIFAQFLKAMFGCLLRVLKPFAIAIPKLCVLFVDASDAGVFGKEASVGCVQSIGPIGALRGECRSGLSVQKISGKGVFMVSTARKSSKLKAVASGDHDAEGGNRGAGVKSAIRSATRGSDVRSDGVLDALNRCQAVIEFYPDGTIIGANGNFLNALGYEQSEIEGAHHRIFCDKAYADSIEYKQLWRRVAEGEFVQGVFRRIRKDGTPIWINASYNPVFDKSGQVVRAVKFATDVTAERTKAAETDAMIQALSRSQAVIEFKPDGTILTANENFLSATKYRLSEIQGQHHRIFCDEAYTRSSAYTEFWRKLQQGEFQAGEFRRLDSKGNDVWILASYNPVFDLDGKVAKVVKFATEITAQKLAYFNLVKSFEEACTELSRAAQELTTNANLVTESSNESNRQATAVATASEEVYRGVHGVSTASEEMLATVREIASSASQTSKISNQAKADARTANETVEQLAEASQEIGNVIKVISSIAQQTNLLALNATIEAARAGDAGRGFAVVANEVKELAKQTARATDDITAKIVKLQGCSKETTDSLCQITGVIDEITEIATSTSVATEEQGATTNEVVRLLQESNTGVQSITTSIRDVAAASERSLSAAHGTKEAADRLSGLASELMQRVEEAKRA
jgi:methyl-accepting chemotaxis protein